jgi:reverse gyrase
MEELKCVSCGGKVDINEELMIGVCEYCGSQQPLPEEVIKALKLKKRTVDKIEAEKLIEKKRNLKRL